MIKNIIISIVLIFTNSIFGFANQPHPDLENLQKETIEIADLIFLGELISFDTITEITTFRIFEKFKGNYNSDTIRIKFDKGDFDFAGWKPSGKKIDPLIGKYDTYDYSFLIRKGLWLVYTLQKENTIFRFCRGGLSRGLEHPENLFILTYIKNHPKNKIDSVNFRIKVISDWFLELEKLKKIKKPEIQKKEFWDSRKLTITLLTLSMVNLILIIYLMFRKRQNKNDIK